MVIVHMVFFANFRLRFLPMREIQRGIGPVAVHCPQVRTLKIKGCLCHKTALTMVIKFCRSVQRKWRRLDGPHRLAEIVKGVECKDGETLIEHAA